MGQKRAHANAQPKAGEREPRDKDREGAFISSRSSMLSATDLAERKKENSAARSTVSELGAMNAHAPKTQ